MTAAHITFGQWLKQRRKSLGLTQKELARQAGCAEVSLRRIESGDLQPSAALVASLARVLGVADASLPSLVSLARGRDDDFSARARLLRPQRPNNLPAQLTPLIGRQHDIVAVRKRLLSDGARLVTLVGPPGVGKTRLALAVAEEVLEQFEHGAFFVRLAPVSDPTQVASAIAQALGMEMSGPNPPDLQLRAWLEEKHLLLVLDNFEQIVAAAPLVDDLLRRCPWLHVLVTSRQLLRVRGERQITVHPLPLPAAAPSEIPVTAEDMLRYPAVALFADRAEAVMPDFAVDDDNAATVTELCRRLDGLPLAIELVAARVKLLPPDELLMRLHGPWLLSTDGLRDVSARQKTLRGAIGWSYDLLTPVEQTLFSRLTVFVGGCTLVAAEMMCEDVLSPAQVLSGIASLLDKNLLHRQAGLYGETRYAMLETVREYGLERLAQGIEENPLRERHARCFMRLVDAVEQIDPDPDHILLNRLIDDENHNVRAALAWAMEHDTQAALLLTAALLDWIGSRGPHSEKRRLLAEVFALPGASARTAARAKALLKASWSIRVVTRQQQAAFAAESIAISQELGYARGEADASIALGRITHFLSNDQHASRSYLETALGHYRRLCDTGGTVHALAVLSEIALAQGDLLRARELAEECLDVARRGGFSYPGPLAILANIALAEGLLDTARLLFERHLVVQRPRGSKATLIYGLRRLGNVATRQGDFAAAHGYLNDATTLAQELGDQVLVGVCSIYLAVLFQAEGDYTQAFRLYRKGLAAVGTDPGDWWGLCLLNLAVLAEKSGQLELGARLLGAIDSANETIFRLYPIDRNDYNRLAEMARSNLAPARFDGARMEGRLRRFEQIAEETVSILEAVVGIQQQVTHEPSRLDR